MPGLMMYAPHHCVMLPIVLVKHIDVLIIFVNLVLGSIHNHTRILTYILSGYVYITMNGVICRGHKIILNQTLTHVHYSKKIKKQKMKPLLIAIFILVIQLGSIAQSPAATQLANHIAQKMKDTLGLTEQQKSQVYNINVNLNNLKMAVRQQYTNYDSLRIKTQLVEHTRDSLYHIILLEPTYQLYLQKKRNLVTAN